VAAVGKKIPAAKESKERYCNSTFIYMLVIVLIVKILVQNL